MCTKGMSTCVRIGYLNAQTLQYLHTYIHTRINSCTMYVPVYKDTLMYYVPVYKDTLTDYATVYRDTLMYVHTKCYIGVVQVNFHKYL